MKRLSSILLLFALTVPAWSQDDGQFARHLDVSGGDWVFYNLTEKRVASEQEANFGAWDVAFQGTAVRFNGPSMMMMETFENVEAAPEEGYAENEDGTSELPSEADTRWFDYDFNTHVITPKSSRTAVFQTKDGHWAKLNITDYYKTVFGEDPIPRMLSFRWDIQEDGSRYF